MFGLAALLFAAGNVFAVTGACVNCHTMHNSQDNAVMTFNSSATAGGMLLRGASCGGCHADATANTALGGAIPQVNVSVAANVLPGGSFYWVAGNGTEDDPKGHNVSDLGIDADVTLTTPPGWTTTTAGNANTGTLGTDWATNQLTCAGTYGCHGDHDYADKFDALQGAHHTNAGNDGTAVGGSTASVGESYRFLKTIQGIEMDSSSTWVETNSNHNVYYGAVGDTDNTTISELCAQCHGNFHLRDGEGADDGISAGGTASPWLRHPTDIDMKGLGGEYALYVYDVEAPIGVNTLTGMDETAAVGDYTEQIVTCLSCHRAHGSNNDDLLRWDYTTNMTVGQAGASLVNTGCFRCHTAKDGDNTQ
ncbi:cytochrome c3 family protein [Malonomonas rubra]|nr:cytochrome c3 family protein [Malonomonas rubra]